MYKNKSYQQEPLQTTISWSV